MNGKGRTRRPWLRRLLRLREDRGSASAELVVAAPLLLLTLMAIVQFALWSHATHIAQAAASRGLATARVHDGTSTAGSEAAQRVLDQLAAGPLRNATVTSERSADRAAVAVRGVATPVLPFLSLPVHAEAAGPVERFVPDLAGR